MADTELNQGWLPRWLQFTVAFMLLGAVALGLWVRFKLGVAAVNGTEECGACHIMQPYVQDLKRSAHYGEAACDDCHVPHQNAVQTYAYKIKAGVKNVSRQRELQRSGQLETFTPKANAETLQIVVDNCYRCHNDVDSDLNEGVMTLELMKRSRPQVQGVSLAEITSERNGQHVVNCLACHSGLVHDQKYQTPDESSLPITAEASSANK
ncbi:MAG: NapC/NirT family cytochrome c [bacterium]|nr:NapC/NirT family cytochrome c [bacterium]